MHETQVNMLETLFERYLATLPGARVGTERGAHTYRSAVRVMIAPGPSMPGIMTPSHGSTSRVVPSPAVRSLSRSAPRWPRAGRGASRGDVSAPGVHGVGQAVAAHFDPSYGDCPVDRRQGLGGRALAAAKADRDHLVPRCKAIDCKQDQG